MSAVTHLTAKPIARDHRLIALLLTLVSMTAIADSRPTPGSYGFDWLHPDTTRCRKISQQEIDGYVSCEKTQRGFGEYVPTHACRAGKSSEWIIYATRKECQAEFETMQANGP